MGADCVAAWLGALVLSALSFVPAIMAPTYRARDVAGGVARLSLSVTTFTVLWTTLSTLQLAPPQGGVFSFALSALLVFPVGLSVWGIGLMLRFAARRWLGVRVPHGLTLALGVCSAALVLVVR
jgi:hypothetical protein